MERLLNTVVSEIAEVLTVCAPRGRNIKITDRHCYGLSFCCSGKITYTHNGKKTVSVPDNAVILPEGQSYELYNNEGGDFPLINFFCEKPFTNEFICIPIKGLEAYKADFERVKSLDFEGNDRLRALRIFYGILERLYYENKNSTGVLTPVLECINSNYLNPELNNTLLAETANISEVYLRRLFCEQYGTTPKQYILEMRLRQAKIKLTETNKTVTEIAFLCGFSSVYHFCRSFKQKTGLTPTDYRKANRAVGI